MCRKCHSNGLDACRWWWIFQHIVLAVCAILHRLQHAVTATNGVGNRASAGKLLSWLFRVLRNSLETTPSLHALKSQDVIEQFSPWLGSRFEYFRAAVVENIKRAELGQDSLQINYVDSDFV